MRQGLALMGFAAVVSVMVAAVAAQTPPAAPAAKAAPAAPTPSSCGPTPPPTMKNVAQGSRCFEMRTYVVRPGGPGDAELLHKRFREATVGFFKKYKMDMIGFWEPVNKPDTIVYLLAYKDAAARDAAWAAFQADPEWIKARTAMNVAITATSEFMIATDYSPMK